MSFSFGFAGDDIDIPNEVKGQSTDNLLPQASKPGAFPVAGKPQLPATYHELDTLLSHLPSKIAYDTLDVTLDDGTTVRLPRRELWDVRVQLMAEDDSAEGVDVDGSGLGSHDVKTGVYEGGFKSWESSVDLVKVLAAQGKQAFTEEAATRVLELGCGTALPSLALFQWAMEGARKNQCSFIAADYNPSVLQLVTLPNFVLTWALTQRDKTPALNEAFSMEGELELLPGVIKAFKEHIANKNIMLFFLSGAWSKDFVDVLYRLPESDSHSSTLLLGAETIYSPFAMQAYTEITFAVLSHEQAREKQSPAVALVAAKRMYFGVGGSLDDFVDKATERGGEITTLREEAEGVRRGVVKCVLRV